MIGTCRLCVAENADLQNSHIVPKWAYRRVRGRGRYPDSIVLQGGIAAQKSKQYHEHLLCRACEALIEPAERKVATYVYQPGGGAPFNDLVGNVVTATESGFRFATPGKLSLPDLVHFATSVIWRASVSSIVKNCTLPVEQSDQFRRYLLGQESFPDCAACIVTFYDIPLADGSEFGALFTLPSTEYPEEGTTVRHTVLICGADFDIYVGDELESLKE